MNENDIRYLEKLQNEAHERDKQGRPPAFCKVCGIQISPAYDMCAIPCPRGSQQNKGEDDE